MNTDQVEKFSLDLQAKRHEGGGGWDITGTALVDTVTFNDNGHCQYSLSGSQLIGGTMNDPLGPSVTWIFSAAFTTQPTLRYMATNLDHYYTECPAKDWYAFASGFEGDSSYCTITDQESTYSSEGFALKLNYDCPHTYVTDGVTYTDTQNSSFSGAWEPN